MSRFSQIVNENTSKIKIKNQPTPKCFRKKCYTRITGYLEERTEKKTHTHITVNPIRSLLCSESKIKFSLQQLE